MPPPMFEWIRGTLGPYPCHAQTLETGCAPIPTYVCPFRPVFPHPPPISPHFSSPPIFPPRNITGHTTINLAKHIPALRDSFGDKA